MRKRRDAFTYSAPRFWVAPDGHADSSPAAAYGPHQGQVVTVFHHGQPVALLSKELVGLPGDPESIGLSWSYRLKTTAPHLPSRVLASDSANELIFELSILMPDPDAPAPAQLAHL